MFAGGFRLIFLKAGKARTEQGLIAFHCLFGKWIGLAELVLGFALRRIQALLGLFLIGESADLDHPAAGARLGGVFYRLSLIHI